MSEYRFYLYHKDVGNYKRIKDPVGWDSLGKKIRRFGLDSGSVGLRWHGVFFEYNVKLGFVKDGKAFVKNFYEKYGIEQDILLRIEKRDESRKFFVHYEGRLNLTTYKIGRIKVECNIENTGFLQKLKNRSEVKVNLGNLVSQGGTSLNALAEETVDVTLHSKAITEIFEANLGDQDESKGFYIVQPGKYVQFDFAGSTIEIDTKYDYGTQGNLDSRPLEIFEFARQGTYVLQMRFAVQQVPSLDGGTHGLFKFYVQKNDETPIAMTIESHCSTSPNIWWDVLTLEETFTMVKGDRLFWYAKNEDIYSNNVTIRPSAKSTADGGHFPPTCAIDGKETFVKLTGLTTTPESNCKMVMIHEAWTRTIQSITDRKDLGVFYSDYYGRTDLGYAADGAGSLRGITNGFQIRGIDKPIYCTTKDLVDTCLSLDGMGFGIEIINGVQRVRVEPLTYWYQTKRMMRLNYVLDIEKNVEPELYYNTVQGGVDNWKNNRAANLDEFVGKKEWVLPITQIKRALLIKCPYITSGYTLEYARRERDASKDNTPAGNDVDNSNFVIQLRRSGDDFIPDTDQDFSAVSGIVSPATAYNLKLSPKRCLIRNGRTLRVFLDKYSDQQIQFNNGDANNALSSQLDTEPAPVVEAAPLNISSLEKPMFIAEVYEVTAKLTRTQLQALNNTDVASNENVWGFIEFSETKRDYKRGYLLTAQLAPDSNEVKMELLKAAI